MAVYDKWQIHVKWNENMTLKVYKFVYCPTHTHLKLSEILWQGWEIVLQIVNDTCGCIVQYVIVFIEHIYAGSPLLSFCDWVRHSWFYTHLQAYMCLCPLFPVSLPPFLTLSSVLVPWNWQCFPLIPLFHNSSFPCPIPPSLLYSNNPSSPTLSHFFNEMTPANLIKAPHPLCLTSFLLKWNT